MYVYLLFLAVLTACGDAFFRGDSNGAAALAAKTILQDDMTGDGPMTSPGYLMNILFDCLGWKGPAFMQFTEEIRGHIPVICTKGGYVEDGVYTQNLSESGRKLLKQYQDMQYYIHYRPELAEKMALD